MLATNKIDHDKYIVFFQEQTKVLVFKRTVYILLILFLFNFTTYAQEIIRGTVVDRTNEPIPELQFLLNQPHLAHY